MTKILSEQLPAQGIAIWWIGQSGFFIKLANQNIILLDAYLSNSVAKKNLDFPRKVPIPIEPKDVICDYYICTHNHLDHTDPETIQHISHKGKINFLGPRNTVKKYKESSIPEQNIQLLEAGDCIDFEGFSITGAFCIPNEDKVLDSIGILLKTHDGLTLYHTSDTAYHPFLHYLKKFHVDIMIPCINGKFGNMNMKEAFEFAKILSPKLIIPCHFDMFELNSVDPYEFEKLFTKSRTSIKCMIPSIGQCIYFHR